MSARTGVLRAVLAGVVSLLLVAGGFAGAFTGTARADSAPLDPASPASPTTVTADALPTVQVNGVVWSQAVVGDTVYAAGEFTTVRPAGAAAGTQETVRNNLLAYDIRTGQLITSFAPDLNGPAMVVTASPDGSRIYVGGTFNRANGEVRNRIAAYSTATGQLVPDFRPNLTGTVYAIAAAGDTVYVGGTFTGVGSQSRHRLAAFSAGTGALLPWNPVPGPGPVMNRDGNTGTSDVVRALVVTSGGAQVVVAGHFDTLNGEKNTGVGAVDAVTGATRPFAINQVITNQGINSAIFSLSTDGTTVYGSAFDFYGPGNLEGGFAAAADGGAVRWINDCHGDTYSTFPRGGALYIAGHPHVCSNIGGYHEHNPRIHRYAVAVSLEATGTVGTGTLRNSRLPNGQWSGTLLQGMPAPSLQNWFPTMTPGTYTGQGQAGWSVAGNDQYIVYGGEFPRVNGVGQQGLVRYAVPAVAPNRVGPSAAGLAPTVSSPQGGMARVSWMTTDDQDNEHLTYRVYRDGNNTTPVYEATRSSLFWSTQPMGFVDIGVAAGTHTYRVSAFDAFGNRANSAWISVDVAAGSIEPRAYADAVRADGAQAYWPLGETSGTTALDWAGGNDLAVRSGLMGAVPVQGRPGALAGDADTAYGFNGTVLNSGLGHLSTQAPAGGPNVFTVEAWFRTTSTAGGKIVGFGNAATGNSSNYDRHVYMNAAGQVLFGVYPGAERIVSTSARYNDGNWHHVVASLSPAGMALYLDGQPAGSRTDTTSAQAYNGYWRVGGDTSWSGARYFAGDIDEVAIYPVALTADRIANHFSLGTTGEPTNLAPSASFTSSATHLAAAFDAAGSSDPDGSIASYAWEFGNGATGTGSTAAHTYTAAGTYTVTLTVTDDDGATAQTTATVTVTEPPANVAPTAAFTVAADGLDVSVDGTGSSEPDGSIASYAWDFGDGETGTGATADHSYAAAGTYTVTLTVTDDDGATGVATESVTVTEPVEPTVLASDVFGRSVTGGLGTADVGGAWSASAGGSRQSVTPGVATFAMTPGTNTGAYLGEVSQTSADVRTSFSLSATPTGGGAFVYVPVRRVETYQEYRARVRVLADGSVRVALTRFTGTSSETLLGGEVPVAGLTYAPGTVLNVRTQAEGTGTTALSVTVWPAGSAEPAEPTVSRTDSTEGLQTAGAVGLFGYLSGSATAPVAIRFTGFSAVPVGAPAPDPDTNRAPEAAFTTGVAGLDLSVDGSGSTDPDGSIASYAWDFGDGTTGTGVTASHAYAAAGTYTVTLTVTDAEGASATEAQQVTVTAPGGGPLAADAFGRDVAAGWGAADLGGTWVIAGGEANASVTGGAGQLTSAAGRTMRAVLEGLSRQDVAVQADVLLPEAPTGGGTLVSLGTQREGRSDYRATLSIRADGAVYVRLDRMVDGAETVLGSALLSVPHVPGEALTVRFETSGTGTTTLRVKVWRAGTPEPVDWTLTRTDATAALQRPGGLVVETYTSGSATRPSTVRLDNLWAGVAGEAPPVP
jgi:PKD repeat protein